MQVVAVSGRAEVNLSPLDLVPEAFDKATVGCAAPSVATDATAGGQQSLLKSQARKLTTLAKIEDVRSRGHAQSLVEGQ